jgi:hypothetical protein
MPREKNKSLFAIMFRHNPPRECRKRSASSDKIFVYVNHNGKQHKFPLATTTEADDFKDFLLNWDIQSIGPCDSKDKSTLKNLAGMDRLCIKVKRTKEITTYMHLDAFACCLLLHLNLKGQEQKKQKCWREAYDHVKTILDKEQPGWCTVTDIEAERPKTGGLRVPGFPERPSEILAGPSEEYSLGPSSKLDPFDVLCMVASEIFHEERPKTGGLRVRGFPERPSEILAGPSEEYFLGPSSELDPFDVLCMVASEIFHEEQPHRRQKLMAA